MSGIVDKSMCSPQKIAVTVVSVTWYVPRDADARRWVSWNVPEAFWDRVLRALEEHDRWEAERGGSDE